MASMILPSVIEEAGGSEKFIRGLERVGKLIGMKINLIICFEYGPKLLYHE